LQKRRLDPTTCWVESPTTGCERFSNSISTCVNVNIVYSARYYNDAKHNL